jgi:ABC-type multidrug transport system fused ATPase/permease subunit
MYKNKNLFLKLLRLSSDEWPILAKGIIFLFISSAALMVYPQYIKTIIDDALKNKDLSNLNQAAILAFVVFVIQSLSSSFRYYYFTLAGEKTVKRLRLKLFSQIIYQEPTFFDQSKTGELLGRLSSDTSIIQNALSVNISMLLRNFYSNAWWAYPTLLHLSQINTFHTSHYPTDCCDCCHLW